MLGLRPLVSPAHRATAHPYQLAAAHAQVRASIQRAAETKLEMASIEGAMRAAADAIATRRTAFLAWA